MKMELNNLDDLKKKNPFSVPEGYMENLTSNIMAQIPEKTVEAKRVTLMERMRPWVYMAAMFAGLGLFFRVLVGVDTTHESSGVNSVAAYEQALNDDYLEYLETQYTDVLLADEWKYWE